MTNSTERRSALVGEVYGLHTGDHQYRYIGMTTVGANVRLPQQDEQLLLESITSVGM